jgi:hypothetical protein
MSKCPECGSTDTAFNSLMSYENGFGEVRSCRACSHQFEVGDDSEPDEETAGEDGYVEITVTLTRSYLVKMDAQGRTDINGWPVGEVVNDWFHRTPLGRSHATRDSHMVGNSEKLVSVEVNPVK